jgi:hypothetical protein
VATGVKQQQQQWAGRQPWQRSHLMELRQTAAAGAAADLLAQQQTFTREEAGPAEVFLCCLSPITVTASHRRAPSQASGCTSTSLQPEGGGRGRLHHTLLLAADAGWDPSLAI